MQSISGGLRRDQEYHSGKPYRIVEMEKLYWNGAATVWESPIDISLWVISVSTAKWKLDSNNFNEWLNPSFQITVDDSRKIWGTRSNGTLWKTGANQPYYPDLTRIRVRCGYTLSDGTSEDKYVFTGYINHPIGELESTRQAILYCVGPQVLLDRTDAEDLSITETDEAVGAGSGTVFTTAENAVSSSKMVVKKGTTGSGPEAASTLTPDTDYELEDTNIYGSPAQITLKVGLQATETCWVTYKHWYLNKTPSWIVEQLLDLVPISSYTVAETIFDQDVENTWTQDETAEFDAGTQTNIDTSSIIDRFARRWWKVDDFSDGDYTVDPVWAWNITLGTPNISAATNALVMTFSYYDTAYATTPFSKTMGSWNFKVKTWGQNGEATTVRIRFMDDGTHANGYMLRWAYYTNVVQLVKITNWSETTLADLGNIVNDTAAQWRMTRTVDGVIVVYKDGVQVGTATDTTHSFSTMISIRSSSGPSGLTVTIDDVYYSPGIDDGTTALSDANAVQVSDVLDTGAGNPNSYGRVLYNAVLNGGAILVETYTSGTIDFSADNDPAGWVTVSDTGGILSALKRYIMARFTFTEASLGIGPYVTEFSIVYYTSTTTIDMVNMEGLDVHQSIQQIAGMPGYEIGFKADQSYFYRPRVTSGPPILTISAQTNLKRETYFNDGTDKTKNTIDVTFGVYRKIVDSNTQGESHPHSLDLHQVRRHTLSGQNLIPKSGSNIADAAAVTLYKYLSPIRKHAGVEMKFFIQYELGDKVLYEREFKNGRWLWGDTTKAYGNYEDLNFVYYSADKLTSGWDIEMRIEGIEFTTDPGKWALKYDLVEIV